MTSPLVRWLAGLTADDLAALLTRRPDVLAGPPVSSLTGLAGRLQQVDGVMTAVGSLPLPALQLIEVLQAFGGSAVGVDHLASAVGRKPGDAELAATVQVLAQRALVWPDGDDLRMADPLWSAFEHPLNLGAQARVLLDSVRLNELRDIAAALGLPRGRTRASVLADVCAALADGDRVRALVATAPPETRRLLDRMAWHGPLAMVPVYSATSPIDWAIQRGLLVSDGWQHAQMPGEVGMALRGPDWRAPFDPQPPAPRLAGVAPDAVAGEAAAAASAAVEQTAALFGAAATTPVALLKSGGVGAREIRRLAKSVGCGESEVRLWLELGYAAGLLGISEGQVLPTEAYDSWSAVEPARRLVTLLRAWTHLPAAPLTPGGSAVLVRDGIGFAAYELRPALLQAVAEVPDGQGVAGGLADVLRWRLPLASGQVEDVEEPEHPLLDGLWREAHLVGAVAHGALTPLGRALLDGAALDAAAAALLPPAVGEAVFQNDLTAVVPGAPAAALSELLDAAAVRESSGGAVTWRFSAASVRAALDAGHAPDELLVALRGVAVGGALPQVLEYLVADTGRQHGRVRVRPVACVLRAEDPALLAELAGVRALRSLGLTVLAPTVLASARPVAETLAALRSAGYSPVGEDAAGGAAIERAPKRRVSAPSSRTRPAPHQRRAADPTELAERLLKAGPAQAETLPEPLSVGLARTVREHASHLSAHQRLLLMTAVNQSLPVRIRYTDSDGLSSTRVIEPLDLDGPKLSAWCQLRDDERVFLLSRIESVSPAS